MSQQAQGLSKSEERQLKQVLQTRVKDVTVEYFKDKKRITVKDKELRKFVNTTIRFEKMDLEKNLVNVVISAKAEDTIKVVVLPKKGLSTAGKCGVGCGIAGLLLGIGVGGGVGAAIVGGIWAIVGGIGGALGFAIGIPVGAFIGGVAGAGGGAGIGAAIGFALDKRSCTAEEIFPLLATDGFEERGSDGRVKCTVKTPLKDSD